MQVGFIGLGAMGIGMASNLAKAGCLDAVYNRTQAKAEAFASEWSVAIRDTPQALAEQAEVMLLCVSADADVLAMVAAIAETAKPGSVVVDMSTVSRDTACQAAALLAARQVDFLDAPVSGGVEGARDGRLVMMVGGDAEVLARVHPVLAPMTRAIEHLGATGSGQACKAVNQIMAAGINQAVTEALAFAEAQALELDKVIDIVAGGAAGNWFLQHRGKTMVQGSFKPGFKLALHHKDLLICQQMARQASVPCVLTEASIADYARLMQQGLGDEDISALYRLKRPL